MATMLKVEVEKGRFYGSGDDAKLLSGAVQGDILSLSSSFAISPANPSLPPVCVSLSVNRRLLGCFFATVGVQLMCGVPGPGQKLLPVAS